MRYIVVPKKMEKNHPMWPNQEMYYIRDCDTGNLSLSCYTTLEVAQKIVKEKNKSFTPISLDKVVSSIITR